MNRIDDDMYNLNSSNKEDQSDTDSSDTESDDITDEKENILLGIFLENISRKLNSNSVTTEEKTEIYRFILNFNNVKNIESNEYLKNKNMLKYYILGWYVSSNLSSSSSYSEPEIEFTD
jgi:hypothetical protein